MESPNRASLDQSQPAMTPQQAKLSSVSESALKIYKELVVGDASYPYWAWYELLQLTISGLPGLLGFGLRSLLYPTLFSKSGRRPAFGRGIVLRNPQKITLGKGVLIDDYAALDARGTGAAISMADHVSVGRYTTVAAKGGRISFGCGVNIGSYCRVATQSSVEFGESVLVAAYCYIGPGNHQPSDGGVPLISREMEIKGGVRIGDQAWIGAHSTILDGVMIGRGAIVGAHSLVRESVPDGAVVAGVPAKIIKQ